MLRPIGLALLLAAFALPAAAQAPLRVVSWNLAPAESAAADAQAVGKALRAAQPDLVALQGVTEAQLAAIAKAAGLPHRVFGARRQGRGSGWLGRWPLAERLVLELPDDKDGGPCTAIAAAVQLPAAGDVPARRLIVVATRLARDRSHAFTQVARLNIRFRAIETATLLAGDLGHARKTSPVKLLSERFVVPAKRGKPGDTPAAAPAHETAHLAWRPKSAFRLIDYRVLSETVADRRPVLLVVERK